MVPGHAGQRTIALGLAPDHRFPHRGDCKPLPELVYLENLPAIAPFLANSTAIE
jgi:hypothetical protein